MKGAMGMKKPGFIPPSLRRLPARTGSRPQVDWRYPCLQLEERVPAELRRRLLQLAGTLEGVSVQQTGFSFAGEALVLEERLAKGKPEAFVRGREFAVVREEGSIHLTLDPGWGQKVLTKGWATIHPLARYMAGAVPPQSLILYAPRNEQELKTIWKVIQAAYSLACGRVGDLILPDTAW
jgi:hypothetical protein